MIPRVTDKYKAPSSGTARRGVESEQGEPESVGKIQRAPSRGPVPLGETWFSAGEESSTGFNFILELAEGRGCLWADFCLSPLSASALWLGHQQRRRALDGALSCLSPRKSRSVLILWRTLPPSRWIPCLVVSWAGHHWFPCIFLPPPGGI